MSAAFDTIDHDILVNRLHGEYGIGGCVLNWFNFHLRNRTSRVMCKGPVTPWRIWPERMPTYAKYRKYVGVRWCTLVYVGVR